MPLQPGRRYYRNWYSKLSLGPRRRGRQSLYIGFAEYINQFTPEEAAEYRRLYVKRAEDEIQPVEGGGLARCHYDGVKAHDPGMLVSDDGGDTFRLATVGDLLP